MGDEHNLEVYIDESGKFWNKDSTKDLSVVSFAWRTADPGSSIPGIEHLEAQLRELGHLEVFHTAPLTPETQRACLLSALQSKFDSSFASFSEYEKIHLHYDDGQPEITKVLSEFQTNNSSIRFSISQAHKDSRVFQVADYATFIDRLLYKIKHHLPLSRTEACFFNEKSLKLIQRSRPS